MPHNLNTDGQLRSLWIGDENCGGELDLSRPPPSPHSSHPLFTDRQCLGGEDWGQGVGLPRPHATSWKGDHRRMRGMKLSAVGEGAQ